MKLVVITGGSSGIGKQLAKDFLSEGDRVIVVSENAGRLTQAVADLGATSARVVGVVCDIGDRVVVARVAQQILAEHGCPDILINCAGAATYRPFEMSDADEVEELISVNLLGAMRLTKAFLPRMIERRAGAIVNIASIAGRIVITPNGAYAAAKHGMVAWSEALRYELARFNIRIHVVCPGRVETAFFDHETFRRRVERKETRYTITVEGVSKATRRAVVRRRFMTYVPWAFGPLVWLINVAPFVFKPALGRLMRRRIDAIYAADEIPVDEPATREP